MSYDEILPKLRQFYDRTAEERDRRSKALWKAEERQRFLEYLVREEKRHLLEIGAGSGQDSKFFLDHGLEVISTDLSPEMVERCRQKGLTARVMDFMHLDFPEQSFDAIYSLNCLLHVSKADLPTVLRKLRSLLKPTGLFYYGVYGGEDKEGFFEDRAAMGSRFFSYQSHDQILRQVDPFFHVLYFNPIDIASEEGERWCFQSLILRKK